jgi:hypothetical protein
VHIQKYNNSEGQDKDGRIIYIVAIKEINFGNVNWLRRIGQSHYWFSGHIVA